MVGCWRRSRKVGGTKEVYNTKHCEERGGKNWAKVNEGWCGCLKRVGAVGGTKKRMTWNRKSLFLFYFLKYLGQANLIPSITLCFGRQNNSNITLGQVSLDSVSYAEREKDL